MSGDADAGLAALVYGCPHRGRRRSSGCQVTETGLAVAVTLSRHRRRLTALHLYAGRNSLNRI